MCVSYRKKKRKTVYALYVRELHMTTIPMILKFGINLLYCVKENQLPPAYHSLYLSIFLSPQLNFLPQISRLLFDPTYSNFIYVFRVANFIVGRNIKTLRFIFVYFPIFVLFFHLSLQYRGTFSSNISQELLHLGF